MPRIAWSRLAILALGLPLVSCFDDNKACPSCPPDNSASLVIEVSANGVVDSVHISVDGGANVAVFRDERVSVGGLARGIHEVSTVRWIQANGISAPRASSFEIQLDQGEVRVIVFHNNFPLISAWPPTPDRTRPPGGPPDSRTHHWA